MRKLVAAFAITVPFTIALPSVFLLPACKSTRRVPADPTSAERIEKIRLLVEAYVDRDQFNGSILVAKGDEILLREGLGYANFEHGVPNTPETIFRLASVTKQLTAGAVLRLVERGEIDLDVPVSTYLPALTKSIAERITTHHLLTHSSGVVRDIEELTDKDQSDQFSTEEMIGLFDKSEQQFEPGEEFSYSNAGYVLLAAIIESVTGLPYEEGMQELVFEPLGMNDSGHELNGTILPNRAYGYDLFPDGLVAAQYENKSHVTGAGSIYSTVDDLFAWCRALQAGSFLSEESRERMLTAHVGRYGYGWFTWPYFWPPAMEEGDQGRGVVHAGGCPGFSTEVRMYLHHDITIIALSNRPPSRVDELANKIGNVLLGIDEEPYEPSNTDDLYRLALYDGVDAALAEFERWRTDDRREALPNERAINRMGYRYLRANRVDKAIRIFELYVSTFPEDSNSYDSLGEAYMRAGRIEESIASYRRSLELDPDNSNGKLMLAKMGVDPPSEK